MLARQKLLRARGWYVISVPFFRWAGRSDEARAQWLLQVRPLLACPPACVRCWVVDTRYNCRDVEAAAFSV